MPKVRGSPGQKFVNRAGVATPEYTSGVQNPRVPWQAAATAAASSQAAGVQAAIAAKRFEKGVAKAGDAKWSTKASTVGASRYAPGVQAGRADYETGVGPYLNAIQGITLPPRGPKGDPRNIQRVALIADTLRKLKLAS
jgi:hypothetical protein